VNKFHSISLMNHMQ